eukprot:GEMP01027998.1.p1 GENE.GEMP01027998.1~~GEMP01027998.1.p1  ORF type:complete len:350 (+),score=93.51 GEMP01027998.1:102-1052(+)
MYVYIDKNGAAPAECTAWDADASHDAEEKRTSPPRTPVDEPSAGEADKADDAEGRPSSMHTPVGELSAAETDTSDAAADKAASSTEDKTKSKLNSIDAVVKTLLKNPELRDALRENDLRHPEESIVTRACDPHVVVDMAWALSVLQLRFKGREDIAHAKDVAVNMLREEKIKNAILRTPEYDIARAEVLFLAGDVKEVPPRVITDQNFLSAIGKAHGTVGAAPDGIMPGLFVDGKAHDADDATGLFNKALRVQMWEKEDCFGSLFTGVAFSRCAVLGEDTINAYIQEAIEHGGVARCAKSSDAPASTSIPRRPPGT